MAFYYAVSELRNGRSVSFSAEGVGPVKLSWETQYLVTVTVDGGSDVKDVSPMDVVMASGLPTIRVTQYQDAAGKIIPFVYCTNKTAEQNSQKLSLWTVRVTYSSFTSAFNNFEASFTPQAKPATLAEYTPKVDPDFRTFERVMYRDRDPAIVNNGLIGKAPLTVMSKEFLDPPLIERVGEQSYIVQQYESSIAFEEMERRLMATNSDNYRDKLPNFWLIEEIDAENVDVELSGGTSQVALVTMRLSKSGREDGWLEVRPLIDTHYSGAGNVTKAFIDDGGLNAKRTGFIDLGGQRKPAGTTEPDYIKYYIYRSIPFNAFLQTWP